MNKSVANRLCIVESLDTDQSLSYYGSDPVVVVREFDDGRPDEVWHCSVEIKFLDKLEVDEEVELEIVDDEVTGCDLSDFMDELERGLSDFDSQN